MLWSLEIAASVQTRYRNSLGQTVINYADPRVFKLSRTAIWEELTREEIHPETQVLEPVCKLRKPKEVKVADVDLWRTRLESCPLYPFVGYL